MAEMKPVKSGTVRKGLKGSGFAIFSIALFSLFTNALMLTGPLFMLQVYDRVLSSGSVPTLVALGILVVVLYGLYGFLEFVRGRILMRVARRLEENLRPKVFHVVAWHGLRKTPGVRTQPAQDLSNIRQFLSGPAPLSFLDLPWAPVYLFVVFMLHWWLGVASAIAIVFLAILAMINSMLTTRHILESQQSLQQAIQTNEETRKNIEMATVLGMLGALRERWRTSLVKGLDSQTRASDRGGFITSSTKAFRLMVQSGILGLGAYLAVKQEITSGTMIAASIIMARALAPIEQVVAQWQAFMSTRKSWTRLDRILSNTPPEEEKMPLPPLKGHVVVENLMAYVPGAEKPIISGINFELKPGSGLGIIGPTGAGKSTLAKAIIGVWTHLKGKARIDGATADQWDSNALGKHMGYLSQDAELFAGTIGQNIARFDPEANPEAIVKAAQAAHVHELVLTFPEGYNTPLGEGAANLSGGQRQRIGLARALYGDPALVVLDEPNSNLDAEGEAALLKALADVRKRGGTVIVVAHRPSAIAVLDTLMVMKEGKQIAFGPKDEVLKKVLARPVATDGRSAGLTAQQQQPPQPQEPKSQQQPQHQQSGQKPLPAQIGQQLQQKRPANIKPAQQKGQKPTEPGPAKPGGDKGGALKLEGKDQ